MEGFLQPMTDTTTGQRKNGAFTLRPMADSDLPEVVRIEQQCYPDAWPEEEFIFYLEHRRATCLVADQSGEIAGFIIFVKQWRRLYITDVAVAPSHRRQGLASLMVQHVIDELSRRSLRRIILEVRKSNAAAQSCYRQLGFREGGVKPGYYPDNGEDAVIMEYRLPA